MTSTPILGGGGFVGSSVSKSMVARGVLVRILVRPTTDLSRSAQVLQEIEVAKRDPLNVDDTAVALRDVDDLVEAFVKAEKARVGERVFHIGSGVATSINELVDLIREVTDTQLRVWHDPPRQVDVPVGCLDFERVQRTELEADGPSQGWVGRIKLGLRFGWIPDKARLSGPRKSIAL